MGCTTQPMDEPTAEGEEYGEYGVDGEVNQNDDIAQGAGGGTMNYTNFGHDGNVMMAETGGMAQMADPDADLNIGPDMQYAQGGGGYQMDTAVYNPQVDGPSFASLEEAAAHANAQQTGASVATVNYDQRVVSSPYGQAETYGVEQNAMSAVGQQNAVSAVDQSAVISSVDPSSMVSAGQMEMVSGVNYENQPVVSGMAQESAVSGYGQQADVYGQQSAVSFDAQQSGVSYVQQPSDVSYAQYSTQQPAEVSQPQEMVYSSQQDVVYSDPNQATAQYDQSIPANVDYDFEYPEAQVSADGEITLAEYGGGASFEQAPQNYGQATGFVQGVEQGGFAQQSAMGYEMQQGYGQMSQDVSMSQNMATGYASQGVSTMQAAPEMPQQVVQNVVKNAVVDGIEQEADDDEGYTDMPNNEDKPPKKKRWGWF